MELWKFIVGATVLGLVITICWMTKLCLASYPPIPNDSKRLLKENYTEALSSQRHYSGLRFVMLTLFAGITGFLIQRYFESECPKSQPYASLPAIGVWITIIFFLIELVLDAIQSHISSYVACLNPNSHLKTEGILRIAIQLVRIPILWIYALVCWLWLSLFTSYSLEHFAAPSSIVTPACTQEVIASRVCEELSVFPTQCE